MNFGLASSRQTLRLKPRLTRFSRGVTLIEMSILVAVLAVVTSTAAPGMVSLLDGRRLEGSATQLTTDIHLARSEAVARNQPVRLSLYGSSAASCYVIHTGLAAQCSCTGISQGAATCSGDARQIKTVVLPAAQKVALQANVVSILFDPLHGTATPAGTLRLLGTDGRAVHQVINLMGRVRTCSPVGQVPAYRSC